MAFPYTQMFTQIGSIGKMFNDLNASLLEIPTDVTNIQTEYIGFPQLIPNLQNDSEALQTVFDGFKNNDLVNVAQQTLIYYINLYYPQPNLTLSVALLKLISQMQEDGQSIESNTIADTLVPNASNIGNGVVVCTTLNAFGQQLQMVYDENIQITCSQDSYSGGRVAGYEIFNIQGQFSEVNEQSQFWPEGSGASIQLQNCSAGNATIGNSGALGQLLNNGTFETWTVANIPDGWVIIAGAAGTEVLQDTTHPYTGTSDLELVGTGTNIILQQSFNNGSVGTGASLTPLTPLAFTVWMRCSSSLTSGGTISFQLYDNVLNQAIDDASGNQNWYSVLNSSLTTTYQPFTFVFRTNRSIPNSYSIRIYTTNIDSGKSINVDQMALSGMVQSYSNGPSFMTFSGSQNWVFNDQITAEISNNYTCPWTSFIEQSMLLNSLGLIIPNQYAPYYTISNSLIT